MPTIYDLKPRFQAALRPLCTGLYARGVTANQVTLAALALSAAAGLSLTLTSGSRAALLALPPVLFARMALNAVDGMLAREHGMQSALGGLLNEMADVLSDTLLYLPFALVPGIQAPLVVLLVISAVMVEMVGVVAVQVGASRRYDGPLGKSDRALLFGLLALLLALASGTAPWLNGLLAIGLLLSLATLFNRARRALRELQA